MNNPEQTKDFQIPKLKKKKFNTISVSSMKKEKKPIINEIVPIKNRDKESLLTYNFNKDTYSKEQRLLINVLNNNFNTSDINRIHNRLKRTQTKKNYKTMIYSNEDIKTMSNKNKKPPIAIATISPFDNLVLFLKFGLQNIIPFSTSSINL